MSQSRLYIPTNVRLQTIWRVVHPNGTVSWQAWTACHDRNAPFEQMLGTALVLHANGSADRMTIRPDDTTQIMTVMPPVSNRSDT
jgi:hypothetical protein